LVLETWSAGRLAVPGLVELPSRGDDASPASFRTAVLVDTFLDTIGRDVLSGDAVPIVSFRIDGDSRRSDRDAADESDPGTGEGALLDPTRAAVVALSSCART
jgi:hypothetical protein